MHKLISLAIFIFLIPQISAVFIDNNSAILNTSSSNSSITFSLNSTLDYLEITPFNIYILNVTTPVRFCAMINWTTINSNLDSADFCAEAPGGGGGAYIPPIENITEIRINCGPDSIEKIGVCLTMVGNAIWSGYPNAGILILVMMIYIILLLLAINGLLKNTKVYLKLSFYLLLAIVLFILFIWAFQDCQVNQLGDIKSCMTDFGNKIWPGYSNAGILLLGILLLIIFILVVLGRQRKRKKVETKKG